MTKLIASTLACLALYLGLIAPVMAQEQETILANYNFEELPPILWQLPKQLEEISGLALSPGGNLFAHQEKRGIVWEIDWQNGTLGKFFRLGKGVKSDFEGIAIQGQRFYLASEKGGIFYFREGFGGEGKPFSTYDTRAGDFCEVEGLAGRPGTSELLLLCRKAKKDTTKNQITIFAWDTVAKEDVTTPFLAIPLPPALEGAEPSGIEALPDGTGFLVVTTGERFIIDIGWNGQIRGWRVLIKDLHDNPEGITITPEGNIIIADEGNDAQVTVYQPILPEDN